MLRPFFALTLLSLAACSGRAEPPATVDASAPPATPSALTTIARAPVFAARLAAAKPLEREGERFRLRQKGWAATEIALPAHAAAPLRIGSSSLFVEVTGEGLGAALAEDGGNALVFANARPSTDVVMLSSGGAVEELRILRDASADATARYRIVTGPAVGSVRVRDGLIEVLDAAGVVRIASEPAFAIDDAGTRRALSVHLERDGDAWLATLSLDTTGLAFPVVVDPTWQLGPTSVSLSAGYQPRVAQLPSGKIAVISPSYAPALYDAATDTWTSGKSLSRSHLEPFAVLLSTGKLLVGGTSGVAPELWTEAGGSVATGAFNQGRGGYEIAPVLVDRGLKTERVFFFGGRNGFSGGSYYASAERYDVATGTFSYVATMPGPRAGAATALLPGGTKILVAGGFDSTTSLTNGLVYDIAADTYEAVGPMPYAQRMSRAAVLPSGKVLLVGGESGFSVPTEKTTFFDPATKTFSAGPAMAYARRDFGLVQLSPSRFMAVGGNGRLAGSAASETALSTVEVYDAGTNAWTSDSSMGAGRRYVAAALLSGGRVLATSYGNTGSTYEIYVPDPLSCTTSSAGCTCVDGYCCDSPCTGQCQACDVAGKQGICTTIVGEAPHGTRAACTPTILCGAGGVCDTTCSSDAACGTTAWCVSGGSCAPKKANGAGCAAGNECTSGVCADGVCCDKGCSGQCEACNVAGKEGTCTNVIGPPVVPRAACTSGYGCSGSGACATACTSDAQCASTHHCEGGACILRASKGDACTSASGCLSGFCVDGRCCDKACTGNCDACDVAGSVGTCTPVSSGAPRAGKSCGAYASCNSGTCATSCTDDASCSSGYYCLFGACVAKKTNGATCGDTRECSSGICAGGLCCDKPCDGECETCGTGACLPKAATEACGMPGCVGAAMITRGHCSGVDSSCQLGTITPCPNGTKCASATSCKITCSSDDDCVSGACDTTTGACKTAWDGGVPDVGAPDVGTTDSGADVPIAEEPAPTLPTTPTVGSFHRCTKPSDCDTGFCVDGICCDSECKDRCHSCALLTSPGKCTLEPTGVDLKNECGPANSCLGTCGPGGACIGAGEGTMCARNKCVSATAGVGPAYCAGPGATCPTDVVPFDCAPYLCEPAFGACHPQCESSAECANGFVCELESKRCVAPPPAAEDSGCVLSSAPAGTGSFATAGLFAAAIAASVARRRAIRR